MARCNLRSERGEGVRSTSLVVHAGSAPKAHRLLGRLPHRSKGLREIIAGPRRCQIARAFESEVRSVAPRGRTSNAQT